VGDFNVPTTDWIDLTCSSSESSFAHQFIEASLDGYLVQHVSNPTCHIPGQRPSTLDLIFTCNPDSIDEVQHHSPLGSSDHECLLFQFQCHTMLQCKQKENNHEYNYRKANFISIRNELSLVEWDTLLCDDSIDINWSAFKSTVNKISHKHTPKTTKRVTTNKPPWWSTQISKAIKEKHYLHSIFKSTCLDADYAAYATKRNQVKYMISAAKAHHEKTSKFYL